LEEHHVPFEVIRHPSAATTQEAAAAGGISGYAFAKAVMVLADERPQLLVLPAAMRVDLDAVGGASTRAPRIATEAEVESYFGDCAGAIPAVPLEAGMAVFLDDSLRDVSEIVFEAGSSTEAIRMRMTDYMRITGPVFQAFAASARGEAARQRRRAARPRMPGVRRLFGVAGIVAASVVSIRLLRVLLPNRTSRTFAAGVTTGVAAAALADPRMGARRRALVRDRGMRSARGTVSWLGRKGRYARGRLQGARHEMQSLRGRAA
jgi:Ala-tRNA(Pro) deacylase